MGDTKEPKARSDHRNAQRSYPPCVHQKKEVNLKPDPEF